MESKSFSIIKTIFLLSFLAINIPFFVKADSLNQVQNFNIDSSYDQLDRSKIKSTLVDISNKAYFYIEDDYWTELSQSEKDGLVQKINNLSQEFDDNIYPKLTKAYGSEWNPGIDNDSKVTILFHLMKKDYAGYFKEKDQYYKQQFPESNEREMVYVNIHYLDKEIEKSYLSHEFAHLITFNQKNRILGVSEDTWITEMRSEYAPTIAGYNDQYLGSFLNIRVKRFLDDPSNPLTKWENDLNDYASINLFAHYFADHYGADFFSKSLKSKTTDYKLFDEFLEQKGYNKKLSDVFVQWQIANLINDCSSGGFFCYNNKNLSNIRITPRINFLPYTGESSLSVTDKIENWGARWFKIVGGDGIFEFEFRGLKELNFVVPFLLEKKDGGFLIGYLDIDETGTGKYRVQNFSQNYRAFYFIPMILNDPMQKNGGFPYSWTATSKQSQENPPVPENPVPETSKQEQIAKLQEQLEILQQKLIELLKAKIIDLQAQLFRLQSQKR
ncbi:MAG TPA: FlxA-like family protein [Candidatus Pacearchaeota archaeon]|nr:hypothetical protein [Candidatus Parcubacteria bacterium]HNZ83826.1 FlxA-like family protein [Candidatus Pacearchaeota archaeon]HPM08692.1 FlxA-like family protein [Candidatus Pacearchaeota archaeon]